MYYRTLSANEDALGDLGQFVGIKAHEVRKFWANLTATKANINVASKTTGLQIQITLNLANIPPHMQTYSQIQRKGIR